MISSKHLIYFIKESECRISNKYLSWTDKLKDFSTSVSESWNGNSFGFLLEDELIYLDYDNNLD